MALLSFNDYITQVAEGYLANLHWESWTTLTSTAVFTNQLLTLQISIGPVIPQAPEGIESYRITNIDSYSNVPYTCLVAKVVPFGLYIWESDTYTQFLPMPTVTEGNSSRQTYSGILLLASMAKTAGTANSISFDYIDQDGNPTTSASLTFEDICPFGTAAFVPLNSGDCGVQELTDVTVTGSGTYIGAFVCFGIIPIGILSPRQQNTGSGMQMNLITGTPTPVEVNPNDNIIYITNSYVSNTSMSNMSLVGVPS